MSASSLRQRGSLAAVVAFALLGTACGGGSSSGAAAASSGAGGTTAGAAVTSAPGSAPTSGAAGAAPTSGAGAAAPTSAGAAATSSKIVIPSKAGVTSLKATGGGDFCKDLASAINKSAANATGTSPADIKKSYEENVANGLKALAKAPSEIKGDVQVLVDASGKLVAALAKVNYDVTKLTPADEAAVDTPAYTAAATKVATYVKAHCGFDLGGAAPSS